MPPRWLGATPATKPKAWLIDCTLRRDSSAPSITVMLWGVSISGVSVLVPAAARRAFRPVISTRSTAFGSLSASSALAAPTHSPCNTAAAATVMVSLFQASRPVVAPRADFERMTMNAPQRQN